MVSLTGMSILKDANDLNGPNKNSQGHYIAREGFFNEYGRYPLNKAELRDYTSRITRGHKFPLGLEVTTSEDIISHKYIHLEEPDSNEEEYTYTSSSSLRDETTTFFTIECSPSSEVSHSLSNVYQSTSGSGFEYYPFKSLEDLLSNPPNN